MNENRDTGRRSGGKGGYIALAMCMVLAGVVTLATMGIGSRKPAAPENAEKPAAVQEDPTPAPAAPVIRPEPVEELPRPTLNPPKDTETAEPVISPEELVPQVVSPLDGTTVTVFSLTELMYDETMADWRTHDGLDIQAGEGDVVKTAANGTVTVVAEDELMGTTVVISHSDGYTTLYSSLQENPPVEVGQIVRAGETIGYVGSTAAAESSMGPHLHFSVSRDGERIDPREYVG
ncbi:MAG: peptidoglycan DD-metalloendopeptidase family protein [Oscillospiraceae bacterium]|nr:peptidoglycan DD-metalloendopeptidase family protein [Oscillospiraceae bacterium]